MDALDQSDRSQNQDHQTAEFDGNQDESMEDSFEHPADEKMVAKKVDNTP